MKKTNVSNENNFSAYAAFKAVAFVFENFYTGGDSDFDKIRDDIKDLIEGLDSWFGKIFNAS